MAQSGNTVRSPKIFNGNILRFHTHAVQVPDHGSDESGWTADIVFTAFWGGMLFQIQIVQTVLNITGVAFPLLH
jgi:hypothetical protein